MHGEVVIRPFTDADLPSLHMVRAAAFAPIFAHFRAVVGERIAAAAFQDAEAEQAALLDRLCAPGSDHEVLVAALGDEVVGFAAFSCNRKTRLGEIDLVAVHPDMAAHGLGTRLCECCLARMRDQGMSAATVGTGGDPSHAPARRAYEKAGFDRVLSGLWFYRAL